jgi:hypothetical protein
MQKIRRNREKLNQNPELFAEKASEKMPQQRLRY